MPPSASQDGKFEVRGDAEKRLNIGAPRVPAEARCPSPLHTVLLGAPRALCPPQASSLCGIPFPLFWMEKRRLRGIKGLSQGHLAN